MISKQTNSYKLFFQWLVTDHPHKCLSWTNSWRRAVCLVIQHRAETLGLSLRIVREDTPWSQMREMWRTTELPPLPPVEATCQNKVLMPCLLPCQGRGEILVFQFPYKILLLALVLASPTYHLVWWSPNFTNSSSELSPLLWNVTTAQAWWWDWPVKEWYVRSVGLPAMFDVRIGFLQCAQYHLTRQRGHWG